MKKNKKSDARPGLYERVYERETNTRVSQEEAHAEKLEAYRRTAANKRNRGIVRAVLVFAVLAAILLALSFTIYKLFFVISAVEVEGSARYTAEELADAAGVTVGDNLYSFSSRVAEERMKSGCPYIKSLTVKRSVPDKITFTVEEYTAVFFADIYGETFILSDDLTVLGKGGDTKDLCRLRLPAVSSAVMGKKIEFRSDISASHIPMTCTTIVNSALAGRIGAVDLTDSFSLTMECDRKYLLVFGSYDDCEIKLRIADAVLKDEMFQSANRARLDLSNTSETTVTIDNTLTFDGEE